MPRLQFQPPASIWLAEACIFMSIGDRPLEGRVAVVTGGSRGIGRAIAIALGTQGASVAFNFLQNVSAAGEVEANLAAVGRCFSRQCDVRDESQVGAFFDGVEKELGPVDILVNNAGLTHDSLFVFMDSASWKEVLSVHSPRGAWNDGSSLGTHHQHSLSQRNAGNRGTGELLRRQSGAHRPHALARERARAPAGAGQRRGPGSHRNRYDESNERGGARKTPRPGVTS